ncbi:hypothetical protein GCM10023187_56530 [Nibrella viscosa]|uniref:Uncharacterized protein n=1 Tax=Nibrella viscosa TaxID=1084524 RepID=A0ABP8L1I3_9BACT
MRKALLLKRLQHLPDEFSLDELIERLIILDKIDSGQKQYQTGQTFSHENVKEKLFKWLQ